MQQISRPRRRPPLAPNAAGKRRNPVITQGRAKAKKQRCGPQGDAAAQATALKAVALLAGSSKLCAERHKQAACAQRASRHRVRGGQV